MAMVMLMVMMLSHSRITLFFPHARVDVTF